MQPNKIFKILIALTFAMSAIQANALTITPDGCGTDTCNYWTSEDGPWTPDGPGNWNWNNPKEKELEVITGVTNLDLFYKSTFDDGEEDDAPYNDSYLTGFTDSSNGTIMFNGDAEELNQIISCPECFLLVKDGINNPTWYLYDIGSVWVDGTENIVLEDFWPGTGGISYVAIFGTPVPEPGTMIILGVCFATLAGFRLRKKK